MRSGLSGSRACTVSTAKATTHITTLEASRLRPAPAVSPAPRWAAPVARSTRRLMGSKTRSSQARWSVELYPRIAQPQARDGDDGNDRQVIMIRLDMAIRSAPDATYGVDQVNESEQDETQGDESSWCRYDSREGSRRKHRRGSASKKSWRSVVVGPDALSLEASVRPRRRGPVTLKAPGGRPCRRRAALLQPLPAVRRQGSGARPCSVPISQLSRRQDRGREEQADILGHSRRAVRRRSNWRHPTRCGRWKPRATSRPGSRHEPPPACRRRPPRQVMCRLRVRPSARPR